VLKVYLGSTTPLTDRQVLKILKKIDPVNWKEMNDVRPRIVELMKEECDLTELFDKVYDEESGRKVRVCRVSTPEEKREAQARKEAHDQARKVYQKPIQPTFGFIKKEYTNAERVS
jgi:hypothetical protein